MCTFSELILFLLYSLCYICIKHVINNAKGVIYSSSSYKRNLVIYNAKNNNVLSLLILA